MEEITFYRWEKDNAYQSEVYGKKTAVIAHGGDSSNEVVAILLKILPHVHLIISLLKRWLLGTHQGAVSDKHMQAYLEEYTFRFSRRDSAKRGLLFQRLLEGAVDCSPVTYDDLVNVPDDF